MNLVQILPALKEGGVEVGTIDISIGLKKRGHRVMVISNGGPWVKKLEEEKITHIAWPVHKKNPLIILWLSLKLIKLIRKENVDVIHARSRVPGWITYLACTYTKTKWVTTCHGYYSKNLGSYVMGWAHEVIVATQIIKKHMVKDFHVPKEKITLIPRGVDLERFKYQSPKIPQKPFTLGMLGRITPIKGHSDFLKALALLKKERFPFQGVIIGEAPNSKYLQELLKLREDLDLKEEIHFLGHQENIPEQLSKVDLLVLATTYPEAFGRVIIEAQALGVPVIATHVGGVQEVIEDKKTGILTPPHDPATLAKNIKTIFLNPTSTQTLIKEARLKVERDFNKELMIDKTEAIYQKLCTPKKNILVFKLSSLGDIVLISPSLRALKTSFPDSNITLITTPSSIPLLKHCPYIHEIIYVTKHEQRFQWLKLIQNLRARKFDISIDFQNSYWTHMTSYFSGISIRCGYPRRGGRFFLTHFAIPKSLPPVEHQFEILKLLHIVPTSLNLEFWFSNQDRESIKKLLDKVGIQQNTPLLGINIGASWETKRWRPEYISKLCNTLLQKTNSQVILTGDEKDKIFEMEVTKFLQRPVYSLVGKTTLLELGALIEKCSLFVSGDSLPLHIAAALKVPTVAIFGPTDPKRHAPPANNNLLILNEKVDCGPCYRATCTHYSCMVKITPERVSQALKDLRV